MKRIVVLFVTFFALLLNNVEAQTPILPIDTLTAINGWIPIEYSKGVYWGRTYFDNSSAYHGRFSQWFGVERLSPDLAYEKEYYVVFKKKFSKAIKTSSYIDGYIKYARSKPLVNGASEIPITDFAFGYKGQKSNYFGFDSSPNITNNWRISSIRCNIPFDSTDCMYIRISGSFRNTYFQLDYLRFVDFPEGKVISLIDDFEDSTIVGVEDEKVLPTDFELKQNYPNPFNPSTTIQFSLSKSENVSLKVFNLLGQEIATLIDSEYRNIGAHSVKFNASSTLSSGVYLYRLQVGKAYTKTMKMVLVK